MKRSLAFVGDLHVGSRYAVAPKWWRSREGSALPLNEGQLVLYEAFQDFCDRCDEFEVDTVFLMGDLVDGPNRKGFGRLLMTQDLNEQIEMAVELLKPLCVGRKVYGIEGSGYHVLPGGVSADQMVVQLLGGHWKGPLCVGRFAPSKLVWNIQHGQSGAMIYRETVLAREQIFMNAAAGLGKIEFTHVMVRGHWHWFYFDATNGQWKIQVPAWACFVPNRVYLKSYGKMQPDIGGVIVQITDEDRLVMREFLYPLPKIADQTEEGL